MFNLSLLRQFSRLSISSATKIQINCRNIATTTAFQFKVTDQLGAEPMKKKKKIDPMIVKAREERRRKKIEKQIRRLEKNARQLKPIDEMEVPLDLLDQLQKRKRPSPQLSAEQMEARALLQKEWTRYKREEYMANVAQIDRIMAAQRRALDRLYEESEDLYNEAVMPDLSILPYTIMGPVATPPIKNYDSPDGEYIDGLEMPFFLFIPILTVLCVSIHSEKWPDPFEGAVVYVSNPIEANLPGHWIPESILKKVIEKRAQRPLTIKKTIKRPNESKGQKLKYVAVEKGDKTVNAAQTIDNKDSKMAGNGDINKKYTVQFTTFHIPVYNEDTSTISDADVITSKSESPSMITETQSTLEENLDDVTRLRDMTSPTLPVKVSYGSRND
ncbi:hypothetical protein K1T71_010693 [Dendrolimus kikuchii]|uniref:Uncharacterized protein n=1 Tax=Dendrolimus kikuchii TaxID=765133 RepID=A0ACC1CQ86_9NEOP|nr:hypothetical protein K1T71_010693 [Dendrolimus kikuchii]